MRNAARTRIRLAFAAVLTPFLAASAQTYNEAPMLAERVALGELPPVSERLPENPAVVEPVDSIGVYGGTWRRLSLGPRDVQLDTRMGYEPLVRWARSGQGVEPGLAESWDILAEGRTYVFHLRKGLKWSDGRPLTTEDFMFYFEDVLGNETLSAIWPAWLRVGGEPAKVSAPDAHTLVFDFAGPNGIFLGTLAYQGRVICLPKHYMRRFHEDYTSADELQAKVEERGYNTWDQLFWRMANQNENLDLPTWKPFVIEVAPPAARMLAVRNPYYWKVDPEGNQLPYIDRVAFYDVQNNEVVTIKAMAGETDFQARRINPSAYPLFMENRERGGYSVRRDPAPDTTCLYVNQYSRDEAIRPILQDRRFRAALSLAVDRDELIFIMYAEMAVPSRGVICPLDPYYRPEYDEKYLAYDPERANALLDEMGLVRGSDGIRRLPNGERFRQVLHVYPTEAGTSSELWQLVADYYREVGLEFVVKLDAVTLSVMQVCNGNTNFWAYQQPGLLWVYDPKWHLPLASNSYFAPLYGRYVGSKGRDKAGVKPPPEWQRMLDWYDELTTIVGETPRKRQLAHNIMNQWSEECYVVGICRQELVTIVRNNFHNVPDRIIHDWRLFTPGYIGIEQFYMDPAGE